MTGFFQSLRDAMRALIRTKGFTFAAVVTLALGIGANTAIFSLVDRLLLRSLPFPHADRLMVVTELREEGSDNLSWPDFLDLQRESTAFEGLAAFRNGSVNLTGDGEPELLRVGLTTWNLFEVLGVAPLHGRAFTATEGVMSGPRSVLLTHGLWVRRFGADPAIVGRTLRLDGEGVEVAGILPQGFNMPYQLQEAELFLPLRFTLEGQQSRGNHFLGGLGRLKPSTPMQVARQETAAILQRLAATYPETNYKYRAKVVPLQEETVARLRPILVMLQAAVLLVLLIACANVANLLLARNAAREQEMAIRAALGAGREHLLAQLLSEGLVMAVLGAGAGLGVAFLTLQGLMRLFPFPVPGGAGLDGRVLAFALGLALVSVAIFALAPAWQMSRPNLAEGLREGAKGTAGPSRRRVRQTLVAAEVALATSLLIGAGLMVRSLWSLHHVDPGFKPEGVLTASLALPQGKYADGAARRNFLDRLAARMAQSPGVATAAVVDTLPFSGWSNASTFSMDGRDDHPDNPSVQHLTVTPTFFDTMGVPLLRGRIFQAGDGNVAMVSAAFAARYLPGQEALGRRISFSGGAEPWLTIVGVTGDLRTRDLAQAPNPLVFLPLLNPATGTASLAFLIVKGRSGAEALEPGLRAALREQDPDLPPSQVRPMASLIASERQAARAKTLLLTAFGALALLLSAIGIFGVTSFLATQRTREIGIRMALGASVRDVLALILGQGLRTIAVGLAAGLGSALLLARALQSQLFGITPLDPGTYAAVLLLLAITGILACLFPALRAAKVDPAVALRSE